MVAASRWPGALAALREQERVRQGRKPTPSAVILDSQSVKTTERGGPHGYDGAKKLSGRKRHLMVDTLGLVVAARVTAADTSDRDGAMELLRRLDWRGLPRLRHGWVDQGYRGVFLDWVKTSFGLRLEVAQRRDGGRRGRWVAPGAPGAAPPVVAGFQVVPRRWVVERTFAWLGRFRRLSKDYEFLPATSQAAIYLAMCQLLMRRLAPRRARPASSGSHAGAAARRAGCG